MKYGSFSATIRAADGVLEQSFFGPESRALLGLDIGKVCAIEGGVAAMGHDLAVFTSANIYGFVECEYPYLNACAECPECDERETLLSLVWHLNDWHQQTFTQIADWLQSEEDKLGYVTISEPEESRELVGVGQ